MTTAIIRTLWGGEIDLRAPSPEHFTAERVASALGNKCRYTGLMTPYYSVADHCVLGAMHAMEQSGPELALFFLLHELDEVFMPDFATPLKEAVPELREMGLAHMEAGSRAFNLPWPWPAEMSAQVHDIDLRLLAAEVNHFGAAVGESHELWGLPEPLTWVSFNARQTPIGGARQWLAYYRHVLGLLQSEVLRGLR